MRIVAGIYGGRRLAVPTNRDIRPTSDKVRGAVFNMLESRNALQNAVVLDCFCGTGAMGLEALSRGAASCIFIDSARTSLDLARQNAESLGATDTFFLKKDVIKLEANSFETATLAFLDPPYNKDLIAPSFERLHVQGWLAPGAFLIAEAEKNYQGGVSADYQILDERNYGDTKIFLLQYTVVNQA